MIDHYSSSHLLGIIIPLFHGRVACVKPRAKKARESFSRWRNCSSSGDDERGDEERRQNKKWEEGKYIHVQRKASSRVNVSFREVCASSLAPILI